MGEVRLLVLIYISSMAARSELMCSLTKLSIGLEPCDMHSSIFFIAMFIAIVHRTTDEAKSGHNYMFW